VLPGQPVRIVRGEEYRYRPDILRLTTATERGLRDQTRDEFAFDQAGGVHTLGLHEAGIDRIHTDMFRPKLLLKNTCHSVDGAFGGRVNTTTWRGHPGSNRPDINQAATALPEILYRFTRGENQTKDVGIELWFHECH